MSTSRRSHKQRGLDRRARVARHDELLQRGITAHRASDLDRARSCYQQILSAHANHVEARHLLGFLEFQSRRFKDAIAHLKQAVSQSPDQAEFQNNLALAYLADGQAHIASEHAETARRLGHADGHGYLHVGWEFFQRHQFALAETAYRLAMLIEPTAAEPHNYLGAMFAEQQRWLEAEAEYRRAIELNPMLPEAWVNLANALRDQQRIPEAMPFYDRALDLNPRFAAAHNNLGVALANDGRPEEAVQYYSEALRWEPQSFESLNNLGNALRDLGKFEEAIALYQQALTRQPKSAEVFCNLGAALRQIGQLPAAISAMRRGLMLLPCAMPIEQLSSETDTLNRSHARNLRDSVKIHNHLSSALVTMGRLEDARKCFHQMRRLESDQPMWDLREATCCPTVFSSRDEMDGYVADFQASIEKYGRSGSAATLDMTRLTEIAPQFPFNLQFLEGNPRPFKERFARLFAERLSTAFRSSWVETWRGPTARPRIGFVATEDHEGVFVKSLRGMLERLSLAFEIVVMCSRRGAAQVRSKIAADGVRVLPLPSRFDRIAQAIDEARCDVLYYWEVGTDAMNYFLPFLRLAPVQCTSWGIQVTSGIANLDAYLSSELVEPADGPLHYTERLVLAKTLLTVRSKSESISPFKPRTALPLPTKANWYVCAQQLGKFHIDFDSLLAGILRADEQGIVAITGDKYGIYSAKLRRRWQQAMPDVAARIHMLPRLGSADYFSLLHHASVLLDPPHFGGVNSTYDGLSLGKAIIAWPSNFHRGRYTLGCYRKMGITDCVVTDGDEYVRCAVNLATDPDLRRSLETRLREASETLFDDQSAVREHQRIFGELLERAACS